VDRRFFPLLRKKTREGVLLGDDYTYTLGTLIPQAKRELMRRAAAGKVLFLDAGAGRGEAVAEARRAHENIRAYGLALNKPWEKSEIPPEKWVRGHFETTVFPGRFHIIQSNYGLMHAANYALALENLLNSLRLNGKLFVRGLAYNNPHNPILGLTEHERTGFVDAIKEQGFSCVHIRRKNGELVQIFTRRTRGLADLSDFYESGGINNVPIRKDLPGLKLGRNPRASATSGTPWPRARCRPLPSRTRRRP
jgi:SAM-dependent methyltransferase